MPGFDFAAFGLVGVRPESRFGFGVKERDARITLGNAGIRGVCCGGRRELTVGNEANVMAVIEAHEEIGLSGAVHDVEASPLAEFEKQGVLKFVETGLVFEENGLRAADGIG